MFEFSWEKRFAYLMFRQLHEDPVLVLSFLAESEMLALLKLNSTNYILSIDNFYLTCQKGDKEQKRTQ